MRATILLPNYNNEKVLPTTFEHLRKNIDCSKYAFLMVDDGSEDEGVKVAKDQITKSKFAKYDIIETKHCGVVAALNTGLSEITTEYIIRIDGDATVETHDWIEKILKNLDHEQVGMVGGRVIWETGRIHSYGRNIFNEYGLYDMGCCPMESPGKRTFDSIIYKPYGSFSETKKYEVDSILGVCVAFRKEDAISVGGFDTRFNPVWIEDDDFGVLLRKIGKKNIIDPSIHIVHRPSLRGCRKPGVVKNEIALENSGKNIKTNKLDISKIRNLFIKNKNITDIKTVNIEDFIHREQDPWRSNILKSHYISWKEKWGFDPINPDLDFIYNKYWNTELCWKLNPDKHKISKKFIEMIN